LPINEVTARLGICRLTFERWRKAGNCPALVKLGGRRIGVVEEDLDLWIKARRQPVTGPRAAQA
jgi:predicted DNA-binding transcriptional regulator AlpA